MHEQTGGVTRQAVIRRQGISVDTFWRWNRKYGEVDKPELHRLQALEQENRRLKRVMADHALNIQVLRDALGKEW
ncbi:MAG: transposase [Gammaproteobacteria bacterium]